MIRTGRFSFQASHVLKCVFNDVVFLIFGFELIRVRYISAVHGLASVAGKKPVAGGHHFFYHFDGIIGILHRDLGRSKTMFDFPDLFIIKHSLQLQPGGGCISIPGFFRDWPFFLRI